MDHILTGDKYSGTYYDIITTITTGWRIDTTLDESMGVTVDQQSLAEKNIKNLEDLISQWIQRSELTCKTSKVSITFSVHTFVGRISQFKPIGLP